jgi:uncharacterized coiled-coil protein SlyX
MLMNRIDTIVNMVLNPTTDEGAAVEGFRFLHQNATNFGGLAEMVGRVGEHRSIIAQRDAQIATLLAKLGAAQRAVSAAEGAREQYAVEQARKAQQKMLDYMQARFGKDITRLEPQSISQPQSVPTPPRPAKVVSKTAASRSRPRAIPKRRGADTEAIVLSLLTNEFKSISTLFREAQPYGFSGTENAVRFAAVRLAWRGNAEEGTDYRGKIAYRRA